MTFVLMKRQNRQDRAEAPAQLDSGNLLRKPSTSSPGTETIPNAGRGTYVKIEYKIKSELNR